MNSTKSRGVEILIAEDSPTQRVQLEYLLTEHGFAVVAATNGREALDAARQRRPDLIVSDVVMPELDGYGLCKAIKADPELKGIPVILVTTLSDPRDVIRGLECGADNFIRKPYEERYLLARVDYLLMNLELRRHQKINVGLELDLGGEKYLITAERQQILDLLISTYEQAVAVNDELKARKRQLERANEVLKGLYRFAEGLNQKLSRAEVASMALERVMELPDIVGGWILLYDEVSAVSVAAVEGMALEFVAVGPLAVDCLCQHRLRVGELTTACEIIHCDLYGKCGRSKPAVDHISIPLTLNDRALGVLNLMLSVQEDVQKFSGLELDSLNGVGNQLAMALERTRLLEEMEQLVERRTEALRAEVVQRQRSEARVLRLNRVYALLSAINTTIVRVDDQQKLFAEACRIAVDVGGFRMAGIGLLNAEHTEFTFLTSYGHDDGFLKQQGLVAGAGIPSDIPLLAESLQRGQVIVCNDVETELPPSRWREQALAHGFRAIVRLPLLVRNNLVGLFTLYAKDANVFDDDELRLLKEMAGDVAFAIDHLQKEARIDYLAYFDAVTDLPNRTLFMDRASQRLSMLESSDARGVIVLFDIERFRTINETLGRQAGDVLLHQMGHYLRDTVGETNIVARLTANCFGVVMHLAAGVDISEHIEQLLAGIRTTNYLIEGKEFRVAAKAGVAEFPGDGATMEILVRNAEMALSQAKRTNQPHEMYHPGLDAQGSDTLSLETRLRQAIEQGQFVMHYQPKIDLATGLISGLEALIRWNDPASGLVLPQKFIPLLEETGLILEVGRWALEQAAADHRSWRELDLSPPRVAVNVSPRQLQHKGFVGTIENILSQSSNAVDGLELEITESLIMHDIETNIQKLQTIRSHGLTVAIDDFGTGYSSLSYLARLPVTSLKIDRAFIVCMNNHSDDLAIVSTIISLGHSLNLKIVAEGVETEEQAKLLKLLRCDEIQGYLFSPGVPADQVEQMLREKKSL